MSGAASAAASPAARWSGCGSPARREASAPASSGRRAARNSGPRSSRPESGSPSQCTAVAEPLYAERRHELSPAGAGEVAAGGGVELRVGRLTVGGDHQGDLGSGPVKGLQASARAEGLVVGMGGDDRHPAVSARLERPWSALLQRLRPHDDGCHRPGGRR